MGYIEVIKKEIWVLDDEVNIHHLMTNLIECVDVEKEYKVKCFSTNEEVLNALKENRPDIIFIDIYLGEEDGIKLLETVAANNQLEGVKVYVISNLINRDNLKRIMSTKLLTDYIPKPLELEDLKEILEE